METIYSRYRTGNPSFGSTLSLLEELLTSRLSDGYRRIWVQGYNAGRASLIFTIFENGRPYRMEFATMSGFRQFRPTGELETEVRLIEELIERLRSGPLNGIIV